MHLSGLAADQRPRADREVHLEVIDVEQRRRERAGGVALRVLAGGGGAAQRVAHAVTWSGSSRPISPSTRRRSRFSATPSQQRSRWSGAPSTLASSGGTSVQRANACGQRGRK